MDIKPIKTAADHAAALHEIDRLMEAELGTSEGDRLDVLATLVPDFGQKGHVYWAKGFSGHGIVPTCVAGRVLADAIAGDDSHLKQGCQGFRWLSCLTTAYAIIFDF